MSAGGDDDSGVSGSSCGISGLDSVSGNSHSSEYPAFTVAFFCVGLPGKPESFEERLGKKLCGYSRLLLRSMGNRGGYVWNIPGSGGFLGSGVCYFNSIQPLCHNVLDGVASS